MTAQGFSWWSAPLPVLDVETTSTDPATARIVQAAFVLASLAGDAMPGSDVTIVDPGIEVPADAATVHGITTERARAEGKPPGRVMARLVRRVNRVAELGWPLVIFNVPFDWRTLQSEADRHALDLRRDLRFIDPLVIDRALHKYRKGSRKLADICAHYGIPLVGAHDARADALATAHLARKLVQAYPQLRELPLEVLHYRQREWHRIWATDATAYWVTKGLDRTADPEWPGTVGAPAGMLL